MTKFRKMFYGIKNNRDCKTIGENKEGGEACFHHKLARFAEGKEYNANRACLNS